jgi:hypothetical protein
MLFQASRAVTASSEMSQFISVSEYALATTSLLILACIDALGANSGANQLPKGWDKRPHLSSSGPSKKPPVEPSKNSVRPPDQEEANLRRFTSSALSRLRRGVTARSTNSRFQEFHSLAITIQPNLGAPTIRRFDAIRKSQKKLCRSRRAIDLKLRTARRYVDHTAFRPPSPICTE